MKYLMTLSTAFLVLVLATPSLLAQGAGIEWDILNQEAMDLYTAADYDRAIVVAKKALEVAEENVGPNHPDVATSLNNLALLYDTQGKYAQAEPLYKRSLAIKEKALGPNHPSVASSLENIAALYRATSRIPEAEKYETRASRIRGSEKVSGGSEKEEDKVSG